jgi:hypothetical protein
VIGDTTFLIREPTVEESFSLLSSLEGGGFDAAITAYKGACRIGLVGWEGKGVPPFKSGNPQANVDLLASDAYIAIAQYVIEHARASVDLLGNSLSPSASETQASTAAGEDEIDAVDINQGSSSGSSRTVRARRSAPGH